MARPCVGPVGRAGGPDVVAVHAQTSEAASASGTIERNGFERALVMDRARVPERPRAGIAGRSVPRSALG